MSLFNSLQEDIFNKQSWDLSIYPYSVAWSQEGVCTLLTKSHVYAYVPNFDHMGLYSVKWINLSCEHQNAGSLHDNDQLSCHTLTSYLMSVSENLVELRQIQWINTTQNGLQTCLLGVLMTDGTMMFAELCGRNSGDLKFAKNFEKTFSVNGFIILLDLSDQINSTTAGVNWFSSNCCRRGQFVTGCRTSIELFRIENRVVELLGSLTVVPEQEVFESCITVVVLLPRSVVYGTSWGEVGLVCGGGDEGGAMRLQWKTALCAHPIDSIVALGDAVRISAGELQWLGDVGPDGIAIQPVTTTITSAVAGCSWALRGSEGIGDRVPLVASMGGEIAQWRSAGESAELALRAGKLPIAGFCTDPLGCLMAYPMRLAPKTANTREVQLNNALLRARSVLHWTTVPTIDKSWTSETHSIASLLRRIVLDEAASLHSHAALPLIYIESLEFSRDLYKKGVLTENVVQQRCQLMSDLPPAVEDDWDSESTSDEDDAPAAKAKKSGGKKVPVKSKAKSEEPGLDKIFAKLQQLNEPSSSQLVAIAMKNLELAMFQLALNINGLQTGLPVGSVQERVWRHEDLSAAALESVPVSEREEAILRLPSGQFLLQICIHRAADDAVLVLKLRLWQVYHLLILAMHRLRNAHPAPEILQRAAQLKHRISAGRGLQVLRRVLERSRSGGTLSSREVKGVALQAKLVDACAQASENRSTVAAARAALSDSLKLLMKDGFWCSDYGITSADANPDALAKLSRDRCCMCHSDVLLDPQLPWVSQCIRCEIAIDRSCHTLELIVDAGDHEERIRYCPVCNAADRCRYGEDVHATLFGATTLCPFCLVRMQDL